MRKSWLVVVLAANGVIDDGRELFGSYTAPGMPFSIPFSTGRGSVLYNQWFQPVVCSPFVRKWRNWQTR